MALFETQTIPLQKIIPFINWIYFFNAWKLSGTYTGIETLCDCGACTTLWLQQFSEAERPKAEEALKLLRDAQAQLREMDKDNSVKIKALYHFFEARSVNDGIELTTEEKNFFLPTLRQQTPNADGFCLSLCDFVSPQKDKIGLFAISVHSTHNTENDLYKNLLQQTLCDRLVEACSEYLHHKLLKSQGIRPAIGYPSLPDQSLIFDINKMLPLSQINIRLTENGAMLPLSSVCGLYITHPKAHYFMVGKISEEQLYSYAQKRGKTVTEMRKWLAKII